MKALTGLPAPSLSDEQKNAYLTRNKKLEALRPKSELPLALTGRERKEERWDYWEALDDTGEGTKKAVEYGLRSGPLLAWSSGFIWA